MTMHYFYLLLKMDFECYQQTNCCLFCMRLTRNVEMFLYVLWHQLQPLALLHACTHTHTFRQKMHCSTSKEIGSATFREALIANKTSLSAITVQISLKTKNIKKAILWPGIIVFIYCRTSNDPLSVENKWKTSSLCFMYFDAPERGSQFSEDSIICCSTESHFMNHQTTEMLMHTSPHEQLWCENKQKKGLDSEERHHNYCKNCLQ